MRTLLVLLVFLTGCLRQPVEDVVEVNYEPEIKQKVAAVLIDRIETEIERLADEQSKLNMIKELIESDLKSESEWIRSGREVDPREVYRF